jgi:nucleotide-binding universal stress UspA family protein
MSIKRILVPVLGRDLDRPTLRTAAALARRLGSHLEALYRPYRHDQRDYLRNFQPARFEELYRQAERGSNEHGERRDAEARRLFDEAIGEQALAYSEAFPAPGQPSASWRAIEEPLPEAVAYYGGAADLIVVGRPEGEADPAQATAEAALFGSASPVLLAPPGGVKDFGKRVLIGWNRTIPAERAVACAMPFLALAEGVEIFSVATAAKRGPSPQDIAQHLAWHGIQARVREVPPDQRPVGQALLDAAHETGADLLVMGAYSHSRLRETLLGGVTRHVLAHAELPVLMAH